MAVYAIGDVQGCYDELQRLLERIDFDAGRDRLLFCGDLVNRGPLSLQVLRFVRSLGDRALTVLGNHDLHLLALANGAKARKGDDETLDAVLKASDRDELLDWLACCPLMHEEASLGYCVLHAGLPPQWDKAQALACAREVEQVLADPSARKRFLARMYGNKPDLWSDKLGGVDRLRFIVNCFTRLRYCDLAGKLGLREKGPPGSQSVGYLPWFKIPGRRSADIRILFGHWSTLGYLATDNVWALDSGCLWGGSLTAVRIDAGDPRPVHHRCQGARRPG